MYSTYGIQYTRGEFWFYVTVGAGVAAGLLVAYIHWKMYLIKPRDSE